MNKRTTYILGGGTFSHVRNHLALAAPAFGETARRLLDIFVDSDLSGIDGEKFVLKLTKMANPESNIVTNDDVSQVVDEIIADPFAKLVFFNVALCDFDGKIDDIPSGKYATRLKTKEGKQVIQITPTEKVLSKIRKHRKDIFLVAFKTTCGATEDEQYLAGLNLLKANSANLVLANDTKTRCNMIIVPEEARYTVTTDRNEALFSLVEMANSRSRLHFTRSTVIPGPSVSWNSSEVPETLRKVVNHCIARGAYKPFRGSTAGHFAYKVGENTFITSKRKTNFNELETVGMVRVDSTGHDTVIAYGAKPSVGGQSQRIIFKQHADVDCIVHFHCPIKADSNVPTRPQQWLECGSHECGNNTSAGLAMVEDGIKAVYLDHHGPNIVFDQNIDPNLVIDFIERHFDLTAKTGGLVS